LIGHTAEHGIAAVVTPGHTGATADALRAAKLKCSVRPALAGFLAEFWPAEPRRGMFQPEPGCSSPTFRGSGAEVAGLAGALLTGAAYELVRRDASAVVRLLASPDAAHQGLRSARLPLAPALTFAAAADGYEVRLSRSAAASMRAVIRSRARAIGSESETGGVIFGQRDTAAGVIWIDEVSGPPPGSIERPQEFVCGTAGVARLAREKEKRSVGALGFLGIWHTHPNQSPAPSARDLAGMLELLELADAPAADGLIVIAGHASSADPELAAYIFARERLDRSEAVVSFHVRVALAPAARERRDVGLALSGGGSRASLPRSAARTTSWSTGARCRASNSCQPSP
jgi:integrative and conjugative element protein (TIGR02256 family)